VPPRFAYWTILIDDKPTAFRARDQQELMPTLAQLKRTNARVEMKWFAQGRLWDSPEAQRTVGRPPKFTGEKRGGDWRPGGQHKDPRARFDKEAQRRKKREQRAEWNASRGGESDRRDGDRAGARPPRPPAHGGGAWDRRGENRENRPPDRPGWQPKPPREGQRPWSYKPPREGQRPWSDKPPRNGKRPWSNKPPPPPGGPPTGNNPTKRPPPPGSADRPGDTRRRRRDEPPDHE